MKTVGPIPQVVDESAEVVEWFPQDRFLQRTVEETVNGPARRIRKEIVDVPVLCVMIMNEIVEAVREQIVEVLLTESVDAIMSSPQEHIQQHAQWSRL